MVKVLQTVLGTWNAPRAGSLAMGVLNPNVTRRFKWYVLPTCYNYLHNRRTSRPWESRALFPAPGWPDGVPESFKVLRTRVDISGSVEGPEHLGLFLWISADTQVSPSQQFGDSESAVGETLSIICAWAFQTARHSNAVHKSVYKTYCLSAITKIIWSTRWTDTVSLAIHHYRRTHLSWDSIRALFPVLSIDSFILMLRGELFLSCNMAFIFWTGFCV